MSTVSSNCYLTRLYTIVRRLSTNGFHPPPAIANTSESVGVIRDVLTEPGRQADRNVNASEDDPRYEIENSNTGKLTTIYEKNILGKE
ncbi:DUF2945 domain-containing protein [Pectobacterium parmentieri]|nr:DUF2945 domain-containing protein [Pectobacterium parmentieri]